MEMGDLVSLHPRAELGATLTQLQLLRLTKSENTRSHCLIDGQSRWIPSPSPSCQLKNDYPQLWGFLYPFPRFANMTLAYG